MQLTAHFEISRYFKSSLSIYKHNQDFFQRAVANYSTLFSSAKHYKQITNSVYINQWLWSDPAGIYFLAQYLNTPCKTDIAPLSMKTNKDVT